MRNLFIITVLSACLVMACRKGIEFDNQYIRGRAFVTDSITGLKQDIPLKNKRVFLSLRGDTLNYLYTTQTDNEGYFIFNLLSDKNDAFTVYSFDTAAARDIYYYGSAPVERGNKDVVLSLYPGTTGQNGLVLKARDPQGAPLSKTDFRIYNNPTLAFSNAPGGYIAFTSDTSGKGYRLNLPEGVYWVNAERTIDTFTYQRIGKMVTVNKSGFTTDSIMLFKKTAVKGFNITMVDNSGSSVSGADLRIYNNLALAQINDPLAAIATDISDANGKVIRTNLAPGTYYLNAYKQIGIDTFRRVAKTITIPAAGIVTDTMLLNKTSQQLNGFRMQSKDSLGGILPASILYLYNSELLALQNAPNGAGSIQTIITDAFGYGGYYNIPAGDYYINARKQVDTVVYLRTARKITVNLTGVFTDSIQLRRKW